MLTLSVLMENSAANGFVCEHGLSFLLESDDTTILLDTGATRSFLDNASGIGCDLGTVTHIVLSHGHYDHTGGLGAALYHIRAKRNGRELPPVIAHPGVLAYRRRPSDHPSGAKDIDMPVDGRHAITTWPTMYSREPVRIREDILFLGEIPRPHPELCALVGEVETGDGFGVDTIPDDSALVYITDDGLVIIAGCSHSGIVNIMEYAKAVTGKTTIRSVYGGLHCKDMTQGCIEKTRAALKAENLEKIYACHCTGDALSEFPGMVRLAAGERHRIF